MVYTYLRLRHASGVGGAKPLPTLRKAALFLRTIMTDPVDAQLVCLVFD